MMYQQLAMLSFLLMTIPSASAAELALLSEIGSFKIVEDDFVYLTVDGIELRAHSYRPEKNGILPAVIDVHGGAWNFNDRMSGQNYNMALASSGIYVLAIDFRQGPEFQHPLGSRDVVSAVRYLRNNAQRLSIDTTQAGLIGSSSGGHLALLAGLKSSAEMHAERSTKREEPAETGVNYVIALWPVSDPYYRYQYAKQVGRDQLVTAHDNYFTSEDAMKEASIQRVLDDGEASGKLPSVLIVEPGEDANVPREMTRELLQSLQNSGVKVDYLFYPGLPHAFGHGDSGSTDDLIIAMRDFINRQLLP
jgi:acetyl esterase/lipase